MSATDVSPLEHFPLTVQEQKIRLKSGSAQDDAIKIQTEPSTATRNSIVFHPTEPYNSRLKLGRVQYGCL
jgi:hypothetical protein